MRIQFGIWNFDGKPVDPELLAQVHALLKPFGTFQTRVSPMGSLAVLRGAVRTGRKSGETVAPKAENHPSVFWDGRLDNRKELLALTGGIADSFAEEEIIQQAYRRMGRDVFAHIIGDWAISIVREPECELVLARDFVGARPLFYQVQSATVTWSTILEPLVLLCDGIPRLSEEYLSAWLSFFPQTHLTPYRDICSVPAGSFVRISPGGITVRKYWSLESSKPIRYSTDRQYEEHFLSVFRQAVRRRISANAPALAELSGGMDSSSIVCVADALRRDGVSAQTLDTVTYFDAEEPNWDELPYAGKVEEKRGRAGHHIDVGPEQSLRDNAAPVRFSAMPTSLAALGSAARAFDRIVSENGYAVVLSGIGGDEMLGGVPTPVPELADLLVRFRAYPFVRQTFRWALAKRKPLLGLWRSAFASFLPPRVPGTSTADHSWNWLTPEFRARNDEHLGFPAVRFRFFGPLPSLQANAAALEALSRQIGCVPLPSPRVYEWRYPFLDRDLVVFCSSIPREQHVRPDQRRSLMRRAMAGVVPQTILDRKRKAYVSRGLVKVLSAEWRSLREAPLHSEELRLVNAAALTRRIEEAEQGRDVPILSLLRTLALEQWLRDLSGGPRQLAAPQPQDETRPRLSRGHEELLGRERSR